MSSRWRSRSIGKIASMHSARTMLNMETSAATTQIARRAVCATGRRITPVRFAIASTPLNAKTMDTNATQIEPGWLKSGLPM